VLDLKLRMKRLRASQPFNAVVTATVRAVLRQFGVSSELVVRHLHRVGTISCDLPNGRVLRLLSHGDDFIPNQIYWRGWTGYESEVVPLFFGFAMRSNVIVDVGAYIGLYALLAAHANPKAKVFAFEPHPKVYERLVRNCVLNEVDNVQCIRDACGTSNGTATLYSFDVPGLPSGSTLTSNFLKPEWGVCPWSVERVALDRFVVDNALGGVDLLKVDTEGTEPEVLLGMKEALERYRPTVFCEVLPGRDTGSALEAVLGPLGYRYYLLTSSGMHAKRRISADPVWLNWLFTPLQPEDVVALRWPEVTSSSVHN